MDIPIVPAERTLLSAAYAQVSALGREFHGLEGVRTLLLASAVGTMLALGGCGKEPTPPISDAEHQALRPGGATVPPPDQKADGTIVKVGEEDRGPYQETAANLLGVLMLTAAAGGALGRWIVPGSSKLERGTVVFANGTITGLAIAGGCAGIDPTVVYGLGTLANGVVAGVSLFSED